MQKVIDLSYQPKKPEEKENELLTLIGVLFMVGFAGFFVFMFFTGLCGGKFW